MLFEESVAAHSAVSAENSHSSIFGHLCLYVEQISTVMAFYFFGLTVRKMLLSTGFTVVQGTVLLPSSSLTLISFPLLKCHIQGL